MQTMTNFFHNRGIDPNPNPVQEPARFQVEITPTLGKPLNPNGRPSCDFIARNPFHRSPAQSSALLTRFNRDYVTQKCRAVLDQLRANIRQGQSQLVNDDAILDQVEAQIELESRPGHIRVVNATGTILHTNLGRCTAPGFDF